MNDFTIRDLEHFSGIKAHTLRIWEQRYHFLKPRRSDTNIRYYNKEELKTVLHIALLNKYGFRISEIDRMDDMEIQEKIGALHDKVAVKERLIFDLLAAMIDLDMDRFEQVIETYISASGIEKAIMEVIFPFLEKTGILWQTGQVNPAQEHLVSNIIRQKLVVAIETTVAPVRIPKLVLLFLPEGEHHELGLLFIYYLVKSRGAETIYLGANVPLKDVEYIVNLKKPDVAFIHLGVTTPGFALDRFITNLQKRFTRLVTVISGQPVTNYFKRPAPSIHLLRSFSEVQSFIASLA